MTIRCFGKPEISLFACLLMLCSVGHTAKWDNPKKTDDHDNIIHLFPSDGDGFDLVLRRVAVPGEEFWVSPKRSFVFGEDGDSSPFERPVPVSPNGGVKDDKGWWIWLGKYETTVGQFATVMGKGNLKKGLALYADYSKRGEKYLNEVTSSDSKLASALAKPADRLAPVYVQLFIRELNILCFADKRCRNSLPGISSSTTIKGEKYLPFFRLPTEYEWEYAARGVAVKRSKYRNRLPVSESRIENYAALKKISSIGRKKAIHGFYDLFGNVSELVSGRMSEKIGGNRAGAWLARGGKASPTSKKPYSSQREEVLEFEWREEDSDPRTGYFNKVGFRLALGMPMQALDKLAKNERPAADPGITSAPVVAVPSSLGSGTSSDATTEIENAVSRLDAASRLSVNEIRTVSSAIKSALERLNVAVTEQDARTARFVADNTFTKLVRVWTLEFDSQKIHFRLQKLKPSNDKRRKKIKQWQIQLDRNAEQLSQLLQEYEEGLRILSEFAVVDGSIVETIDLSGYQQSDNQVLIALESKRLLEKHINTIKGRKTLSVKRDVKNNYPFPK